MKGKVPSLIAPVVFARLYIPEFPGAAYSVFTVTYSVFIGLQCIHSGLQCIHRGFQYVVVLFGR